LRRLTIGVVLVVSFIALEAISIATALPVVERHLGDIGLYGWIFSAFMLAALAGNVVAGAVSDKTALRGPLAAGAGLFAAGLLLGGLAPTMLVLVLARGVQGFGAGVLQVVVNVAVGRGYSEEMRPKMVAATSSAWVLPSLIGPLIAGVVAQSLSWRWVFLGMLLPVAAASWLAYPAVSGLVVPVPRAKPAGVGDPEHPDEPDEPDMTVGEPEAVGHASRPNRVVASRAIFVAVGAGLFLAGLGDENNAARIGLVLAGLALGVPGLIAVLPGRDTPMRSRMLGALAVGALMNLAFFGAEAFMPLTLTSIHHRSATLAGVVLTSASLTWTTASWVQAHWLPRAGARRVAACGMSLVVLGVFGLFVLDSPSTPWWISFLAWVVAGGGMGLAYSTLNVEVITASSEHRRGESSAALGVLFSLGIAIGTGTGGALLAWSLAHGHGRATGLRLADLVAMAAAVLALAGCRTLEGRPVVCEAPGGD
jgi:MFS family permease